MHKVLIGIPSGGSVKTKTMMSLIQVLFATQADMMLAERSGALGPDNRNHLAQMALDGDYTHLFLVDADMSFPPDTLTRLLSHRKDIVGAAYNYRAFPIRTVVKLKDETGVYSPQHLPAELFPCYAIGSGVKLVTTQALAHIPRPWFALDFDRDGMLSVSDDVWFCQQAARVGISTFCDPTIQAGHIGEHEY